MELHPGERVLATYGDGVGNVNVNDLLAFHDSHGKMATLTAVRPPARFGYLELKSGRVLHFGEKNQSATGWINGGFFVLEPGVSDFIQSLEEPFETGALPRLVNQANLMAFNHEGFWQPMDTLREKEDLSNLAKQATPPWLIGI
jgi:glucose-1-phosphate cytidylyltransferase